MRRSLQSALLLGLSSLAAAIYEDEVGHVDFHHSLVGLPQVETTFFHRPRKDDKASLLYTLSDVGVIGAVNPSNGDIVWRQQVSDDITHGGGHLRAPEGENWVAAAYGQKVQAWNALTGRNVWQTEFKGEVRDLEIMEITETPRKDVLVLFEEDGSTVLRRLHGGLGTVIWEFRETAKDVPLQVSTNIANIYTISLHGSRGSYNLRVTSLDTATGTRVDHWTVGTKGEVHQASDVQFVGANSAAPILAWVNTDLSKINVHVLGTKSKQEFPLPTDTISVQIHAPHLSQSQPHFLVHSRTKTGNKGEVYHTDLKSGQISQAYELPHLPGAGAFSTSSENANVYFTRVTDDEVIILSSESHSVLARWPFNPKTDVKPVHAVSEVVKKANGKDFAVRSAAVTNSQDWVLIRNGEVAWTRPEGLSAAVTATFAEISEIETLAKVLAEEAHSNPLSAYIHRVTRHINDLQYLPAYLAAVPVRVLHSIVGDEDAVIDTNPHHDQFGFNKVIVIVTRRGRAYGLNTGDHGNIIWSKEVFPQAAGNVFESVGTLSEDDKGTVTIRGSRGEYAVIKATDGEVLDKRIPVPSSAVRFTAVVKNAAGKSLLALGPAGDLIDTVLTSWPSNETVVIRSDDGSNLKGLQFSTEGDKTTKQEIWQLQVLPQQKIVDVAFLPENDPIASIGRVLGDRRVQYKYLNPNAIIVAIADESASTLSIKVVDGISGQILAAQTHDGVDAQKDISCTTSENWYACSFFGQYTLNDGTDRSIKGYQLFVADMYESHAPNDRGPLGETDTYSSLNPLEDPSGVPLPYIVSQSWVISQPLTKLSVSQTRQGISTRLLLASLPESNSVIGLPRYIIDPRRPVDRDPNANELEAEGLMRYVPGIEFDSRSVISHERNVVGVQGFAAATAVVESTGLLVAYGIDVYGTHVAPSGVFDILGKGFNKVTLLGTVVALLAGVLALAPLVRKKQINMLWEM